MTSPLDFEDDFRLEVLKALTACLQSITPENGYRYDLSGEGDDLKVFRGRNVIGEDDPPYCLTILEPPIPLESFINNAVDNTAEHSNWELLIQGFVPDDERNPTDPGHKLMSDVKKRLKIEKRRTIPGSHGDVDIFGMKGLVANLTVGQGVVRPPDETSARAFFWLLITLQLIEKPV